MTSTVTKTITAVHLGLAFIYNHRLFQYVRPEHCLKIETLNKGTTETLFVQLLGFYTGTKCGLVVYHKFSDFCSMLYKEQTIDNLAAVGKVSYIIFTNQNSKNSKRHVNAKKASIFYEEPSSRISKTHWSMIKELNVCATNASDGDTVVIPCFTPSLQKLRDPQRTLHSLIWITYALKHILKSLKITCVGLHLSNYKLCRRQREIFLTYPFGKEHINMSALSLRPWPSTLPYIFNTMVTCGDGLTYFEKKLTESESKIKLRKISEANYLKDPSGIDCVNAMKGIVGVYMFKYAVVHRKYYALAMNEYLNKVLSTYDKRDTMQCGALQLQCLLFTFEFEKYVSLSLSHSTEKKLHRIDSTLSWNLTFCYFKLFGNAESKTIASLKKSIQNHPQILYSLLDIEGIVHSKGGKFDIYRQFWLSMFDVYRFIITDIVYYYLDSKSRPIQHFLRSENRPFTIEKTPVLNKPKCLNTNCKMPTLDLQLCKTCETAFFCSDECMTLKKHSLQCAMIAKIKRIYDHCVGKVFKGRERQRESKEESKEEIKEESEENAAFVWGDEDENDTSIASFIQQLQQNNLVNNNNAVVGRKRRGSVELEK